MVTYTPHESKVSYNGQYPDMIEFEKPWETSIQVGQGQGKISKEGRPLQSEGFSKCFGLILRNESNLESALFHVDDIDLTHKQTTVVYELMKNYVTSLKIDSIERKTLLTVMEDINHYENPGYNGRMKREDFQLRMEELNSEGIIQARFILGDDSRNIKSRIVESLLGYLGVKVVDDLSVNTGRQHWSMVYKPNESGIYVDAKNHNHVLTFRF